MESKCRTKLSCSVNTSISISQKAPFLQLYRFFWLRRRVFKHNTSLALTSSCHLTNYYRLLCHRTCFMNRSTGRIDGRSVLLMSTCDWVARPCIRRMKRGKSNRPYCEFIDSLSLSLFLPPSLSLSLSLLSSCSSFHYASDRLNISLSSIVHGGTSPYLRRLSADFLSRLPFDGFAIGGSLGSKRTDCLKILRAIAPLLRPETRPVHLLGRRRPFACGNFICRTPFPNSFIYSFAYLFA